MATPLNKKATAIFKTLIDGLEPGQCRRFKADGPWMRLSIERLTERTYSIAHYFEQNGDLVPDPDMELVYVPHMDTFYPTSIQHSFGRRLVAIELNRDESIKGVRPATQRDIASFANSTWFPNIVHQRGEGSLRGLKKAVAGAEVI